MALKHYSDNEAVRSRGHDLVSTPGTSNKYALISSGIRGKIRLHPRIKILPYIYTPPLGDGGRAPPPSTNGIGARQTLD